MHRSHFQALLAFSTTIVQPLTCFLQEKQKSASKEELLTRDATGALKRGAGPKVKRLLSFNGQPDVRLLLPTPHLLRSCHLLVCSLFSLLCTACFLAHPSFFFLCVFPFRASVLLIEHVMIRNCGRRYWRLKIPTADRCRR